MILTLTGNLLAERTFEFATWQPGQTQRAIRETFQVGGKGINVSKMLNRLGAPNTAICFIGGAPGDECRQWLDGRGFNYQAFRTNANTRTGTVVRAPGQKETTFLGSDVPLDSRALAECARWLDEQPTSHPLAFCGSFPGWLSPESTPLREAMARRIRHGNVYVDTYGAPLKWFVTQPVELVKINRREFDQFCLESETPELSPEIATPDRLQIAGKRWPVRNWVITDGPNPIWYTNSSDTAPVSYQPPQIDEVSATGSGDVLLASILNGVLNRHFTLAQAIGFSIPYATANASSGEIAE